MQGSANIGLGSITLLTKVSEDKTMRGIGLGLGSILESAATSHPLGGAGGGRVIPLDRPFTYIYPRGLNTLPALYAVNVGVVRFQQAVQSSAEEGTNKSK